MKRHRNLTAGEIERLERNGCRAEDWNSVDVAEGFCTDHVHNASFYGKVSIGASGGLLEVERGFMRHAGIRNATLCDVTIGDDCLIENIGNHIFGYDIGDGCLISNVGRIAGDPDADYGEGRAIAVLNEAGDGNVIIYNGLTSQVAAFMVANASDKPLHERLRTIIAARIKARRKPRAAIGNNVRITNTGEITGTMIEDGCEIRCASGLYNCTVASGGGAATYVGNGVICRNVIISAGATVADGAQLKGCLVGEACHIGRGFSAENSVFFANSHMDNGEACAAFCGPFTVSHHKSTLLIGGMFSFYNAGSATNYSNHAYKLGPIHYGTLERGAKTASGAHILMPATIGAFSMCMGKIDSHPDTSDMPFSYVIASGGKTFLVPGRNLVTVGTYRDTGKWKERDMRPHNARRSIINFEWLSPYTIQKVMKGKEELERLLERHGSGNGEYIYGTCVIREGALKKGIRLYDMAIKMFFGEAVNANRHARRDGIRGTGTWTDFAGMLLPQEEAERLAADIRTGAVSCIAEIEERMAEMNDNYGEWAWNMACAAIREYYGIGEITDDDMRRISRKGKEAWAEWRGGIADDARKEALLGDVDEEVVREFLSRLGK